MLLDNNLNNFINDGYVRFDELLDKQSCSKLYHNIKRDRNWGPDLFQTESEHKREFINKPKKKLNPGKGIQNLIDKHNTDFISKNETIIQILNKIVGTNYEIILPKFVVAVPENWMPDYVKEENNKKLISNFNQYIKKEYRDVTYFRGIDYHMDSIDWENSSNQFITLYIYLNDIDKFMSPLNIVKGSHKFGHTSFPHFMKMNEVKNKIEYSQDNKNFELFEFDTLIGKSGTVFLWTSNTLHGTSPSIKKNDSFRISLRYLIKKTTTSNVLLDKCINEKIVGKTRVVKSDYKRILK